MSRVPDIGHVSKAGRGQGEQVRKGKVAIKITRQAVTDRRLGGHTNERGVIDKT